MHYSPQTLALYGDLFEETYQSLEKMGAWSPRNLWRGLKTMASGKTPAQLAEEFARADAARAAQHAARAEARAAANAARAGGTPPWAENAQGWPGGAGPARAPAGAAASPGAGAGAGAGPAAAGPAAAGPSPAATPGPAAAPGGTPTSAPGPTTVPPDTKNPAVLAALLGIPAAGGVGYALGTPSAADAEAERVRTRNIAFGSGVATGIAAPHVIRGLGRISGAYSGLTPEGY